SPDWTNMVNDMRTLLQRGREVQEQINILGDDGVPVDYHITFWKSELIDFVILQQDAFDEIDALTPIERQHYMLSLIMNICNADFKFSNFVEVMDYFKRIINICKQMNYSVFHSEDFEKYEKELNKILEERKIINSSN
ncbi:MAG TPA: V-type ATP synthase subunit A, partial [Paludibacteraceae bacterium]|nr:V-type ATP synthase subunit A [Paludibacteraceae bacterium]